MDEDEILHVNNKIYERDLKKKIRPLLNGGLLKSEVFDEARFEYIPLIKVVLDILREKGLFKKKILKIPENLYLDYKTKNILYRKDKKIMVAKVLDVDPNKIVDLDDFCEITSVYRGEVDFDFRKLGGKTLDFKAIKHSMERKYRVHVKTADLVLFPVWHCRINQKKGNEHRIILIDGVLGNEMILDQ